MTLHRQGCFDNEDVLEYLERDLPDYPFDKDIDRDFVAELVEDFPQVDVLEQVKRYRWFHDNQPPTSRPRLALRQWLCGARRRRW